MTDPDTTPRAESREITGYVALCACGRLTGACDSTRMRRDDVALMLGRWIMDDKEVIPKQGEWSVRLQICNCR